MAWLLDDINETIDVEAFTETCRHCHKDEIGLVIEKSSRTRKRVKNG